MVEDVGEKAEFWVAEEVDAEEAYAPHPFLLHFLQHRMTTLGDHHNLAGVWRTINPTMPTSTLTLQTTGSMMRVLHSLMFVHALGTSCGKRFKRPNFAM